MVNFQLRGTARDFAGLRETARDFARLRETARDCAGLREAELYSRLTHLKNAGLKVFAKVPLLVV